jgi:hypothetical protein
MSKKFSFSVVVNSRKKMVFGAANKVTNVMFVVVAFRQKIMFLLMLYGICIRVENKPIVSWQYNLVVRQKPFNADLIKYQLSSEKNFPQ